MNYTEIHAQQQAEYLKKLKPARILNIFKRTENRLGDKNNYIALYLSGGTTAIIEPCNNIIVIDRIKQAIEWYKQSCINSEDQIEKLEILLNKIDKCTK